MLFNSYEFFLFFPIVVLVYFVLPKRVRYVWLLAVSYYYYMSWEPKYAVLLLVTTIITYLSGLLLLKIDAKEQKLFLKKSIVAISFIFNLAILGYFKFFDVLPIGISFYTFQALSYTMDVYRGEIEVEKNPFKYALFVSFFPCILSGPIERAKNLLKQISEPKAFCYEKMVEGLMLMTWGFFLKLVIADRIAIFVNSAYSTEVLYDGRYLLLATVLFGFQIYCDFAGYSTIALGVAKVLGFELTDNFDCPYYAQSVAEFWRRWHISLSSWFRDYLYIPLGGNRRGKVRKLLNIMIVFVASGIWHGANLSFVVWGGLNGLYQVVGELWAPIKKKFNHKILMIPRMVITFALVDFAWLFFKANDMSHAGSVIDRILHMNNPELLANGTLYDLGLNQKNFAVLIVALMILLIADIVKYNHVKLRKKICELDILNRWIVLGVSIASILLFGIWGSGYEAVNFIYFQF